MPSGQPLTLQIADGVRAVMPVVAPQFLVALHFAELLFNLEGGGSAPSQLLIDAIDCSEPTISPCQFAEINFAS